MLKLIFWTFILVLALSFFGISLEALINSPTSQANFAFLFHLLYQGWQWLVNFVQTKV
ncbi:MAG: hypothetical protein ACYC75_01840 [Minisyncoccota bacterium]